MKPLSEILKEESPYTTSTYASNVYRGVWSRFYRIDRIIIGPLGDSSRNQQIELIQRLIK